MNKELSKDVITHKLVIKWELTKYIWEEFAKWIFSQLANPEKKTITIANPESLLFITKYRSEVQLIPLNNDTRTFEDKLNMYWLKDFQKERFRSIWEERKRTNKSIWDISFKKIVEAIKNSKI